MSYDAWKLDTPERLESIDSSREYREGQTAWFDGVSKDECPYRHDPERACWLAGWKDADGTPQTKEVIDLDLDLETIGGE